MPTDKLATLKWDQHLCGLNASRRLVCVSNTRGDDLEYLPKEPLLDFEEGNFHGCAVRAKDFSLTCWSQHPEDEVEPPKGQFVQVVSGLNYSCARDNTGAVHCFGKAAPAPVPTTKFDSLSVGLRHVCRITKESTLVCFGPDHHGQATPPDGKYQSVSCGNSRCCAIKADSTLACWGANNEGQASSPTGKFNLVEAAVDFTCGVRASGTVCWGANHMGQCNVPQSDDGKHNWQQYISSHSLRRGRQQLYQAPPCSVDRVVINTELFDSPLCHVPNSAAVARVAVVDCGEGVDPVRMSTERSKAPQPFFATMRSAHVCSAMAHPWPCVSTRR